jgi:ankyrin repeat protein
VIDQLERMLDLLDENEIDEIKFILEKGHPLNEQNSKGWSLLIKATYLGRREIFDYLINNGADISVVNNNGTNLLMYAIDAYLSSNEMYFFERLIELGLDPLKKDYSGLSTVDWLKTRAPELIEKI